MAAQMVETPWGEAYELGSRKLHPGPGTAPREVERNQRERLFAAMVAVVAVKGYEATTVADLVEISGVSRSSFYRHFSGKSDCFLATLDELLRATEAATAGRLSRDGDWEERGERALRVFLRLIVAQPAAARLCLVESYSAGEEAVLRLEAAVADFQLMVDRVRRERPEYDGMPEEVTRALFGGLRHVIQKRLRRGDERGLVEIGRVLLEAIRSYRPPPRPLRRRAGGGRPEGAPRNGDRIGGAGRNGEQDERIVRATTETVAAKGYAATTVADIAAAAQVSLSTFYEHFDDKETAFAAAQYEGWMQLVGRGLPAYRRARSWPEAVRATIEATLRQVDREPAYARLGCAEVYVAGAAAQERRDEALAAVQRLLDPGVEEHAPGMPEIVREWVVGSLFALLCDAVRARPAGGSVSELAPAATYLALFPFLGAEAACEIANGGRAEAREGDR